MSGFAVAGLVIGVATTAMSFAEKAKQEKKAQAASAKADIMMAVARERLQINFADALSINKAPYEREREAMLSAGAQVMEQAVESERGSAATAGRLLAAQQEGQGKVRDKMSQDLFNLEAAQAEEDSRLRDVNVQMDLGEVAGAQAAAAASEDAANAAKMQGIQGIGNVAQQAVAMAPLYAKGADARAANKLGRVAKRKGVDVNEYIKKNSFLQKGTGTKGTAQIGIKGEDGFQAKIPDSTDYTPDWMGLKMNNGTLLNTQGLYNATTANEYKDFYNQMGKDNINSFIDNDLGVDNKYYASFADAFSTNKTY